MDTSEVYEKISDNRDYSYRGLIFLFASGFFRPIDFAQTFQLGPLTIHYYGIIMALAAASGFYLAMKRAPLFGIEGKSAEDMLFWVIIGGFIGARIYHVLSSIGFYWIHPVDILKVWNGGLSIYGAVVGGIITILILRAGFSRPLHKAGGQARPLQILDWLAPAVLLGQIIGRFGNLFNYEAFGYPTNLPWKMFVEKSFRPVQFQNENFFHPWFLYEILGNLLILFVLLKIVEPKYKKSPPGHVVFFYILLYNSLRFCLEFLRIDSTFVGGFRLNAIVSFLLVMFGGCSALVFEFRQKGRPELLRTSANNFVTQNYETS